MPVTENTNALITKNQLKRFLETNITNNDIDDLITDLINKVSTSFETYCGRIFISATYTEYFNGGSSWLFPKQTPIISITNIWEDTDWVFTNDPIDSTGYRIVEGNNRVYYAGFFEKGIDAVKMTYVAGYSTIPEDLKLACLLQSSHLYKRRNNVHLDGETKADTTNTFTTLNLLPVVKRILNSYKGTYVA